MLQAFGGFIVVGSVAFSIYVYQKAQYEGKVVKATRSVGSPKIGGPFSLFNVEGRLVTEKDIPGYRLVYFGFTFCPDICPTELTKMAEAVNILDQQPLKEPVTPIFISVDPWRDSIAQVREYVKEFHPRLVGLTGIPHEIERVCKRYRIYYSKPPQKVKDGETGESEFYLVDHSTHMYLFDEDGQCVDYFNQAEPADHIADRIIAHVGKKEWWSK